MPEESVTLASLRKKRKGSAFGAWLKAKWPALFQWHSLWYFFWFVFLLGIAWMFYSFFFNNATQLMPWGDYTNQFVNLCYGYWDVWHQFFKTGKFELYSASTFLGTDNIGSNSYYGLFDPFNFLCVLFPRAAVPQIIALGTCLKGACGALAMRAYLKYMGVSENVSRVGGTAFAFCGFLNFMVGFTSAVSMCVTAPLILLGIEKVIKEKKPSCLIFGLMLLGMISFFYLVVFCIWGVLYALWRYFWTIKGRNWKDNLAVIGVGVLSFGIGIALCSWTLFPSLRESTLSPRTSSIGAAYLASLKAAFATKDFKTIYMRLFEMVGDHPGRELQGLVGFLYPTVNYQYLPLYMPIASNRYDAWTASLFVYTPMAIFFFDALIGSIRRHKWSHLLAFLLCSYLVFTTFAYYFFYAFTGDGYGRWYIILVPEIIYYACQEMDQVKKDPKWQLPAATLIEFFLSILTLVLVNTYIDGKTFTNYNGMTYWPSSYYVPAYAYDNGVQITTKWMIYYQLALVVVEGAVLTYFQYKDYLWKIAIGFISVETIVCGNLVFAYSGVSFYETSFNGGSTYVSRERDAITQLNSYDEGDYRVYNDSEIGTNMASAIGYNGSRTFHSLYNYGLSDFARNSHLVSNEWYHDPSYGQVHIASSWSAMYNQKRFGFDTVDGFKYYVIYKSESEDMGTWDDDSTLYNVPFGSECVVKTDYYRIYKSPYALDLGFGVDTVYPLGKTAYADSSSPNLSFYYQNRSGSGAYQEIRENESTYLKAAIVNDEDVDAVTASGLSVSPSAKQDLPFTKISSGSISTYKYTTVNGYGYHAKDPGSFLSDPSVVSSGPTVQTYGGGATYARTNDKIVITTSSNGGYFNADKNGAFFLMSFNMGNWDTTYYNYHSDTTRIYMIGDLYENGVLVKQNAALNYEYGMISNWMGSGERGGSNYSNLFGFYAPGQVKYIVLCAKGSGNVDMPNSEPEIYALSRTQLESTYASLTDQEHAVTNVTSDVDKFTCKTNFTNSKFVVTHIGYDAGWKVVAKKADGTTETLKTYRVDGGLVGFIAPAGETAYTLTYETVYLRTGLYLGLAGFIVYAGYEVWMFIAGVKKTQRELGLSYDLTPTTTGKKKDEDGNATS
jgi:hypothetical protein